MPKRPKTSQQRKRTLSDGEYRKRCYRCFRPTDSCFCHSIPRIQNRTDVLILQHQRERTHPFNTARIVNQALDRCNLIVDRNENFSHRELSLGPRAAVLYPGKDSKLLDDLVAKERPEQLVIIDGTWDQARTIFRDVPQLHSLPQFKLAPSNPGQYRIRLEPTDTSLSTLEAAVQALQQLEPDTPGFERLLVAFDTMIENQLRHPKAKYQADSLPRSGATLNIPKSLHRDPRRIVVAYGEATPVQFDKNQGWDELNRKKRSLSKRPPVYWIAHRLSSATTDGEYFSATIQPCETISEVNLSHMELPKSYFDAAMSIDEFRIRWENFFNAHDLLVVPNIRTIKMLEQTGVPTPEFETIRSINYDVQREHKSLESFLGSVRWPIATQTHHGRAGKRLANLVSLVEYLLFTISNNSS